MINSLLTTSVGMLPFITVSYRQPFDLYNINYVISQKLWLAMVSTVHAKIKSIVYFLLQQRCISTTFIQSCNKKKMFKVT